MLRKIIVLLLLVHYGEQGMTDTRIMSSLVPTAAPSPSYSIQKSRELIQPITFDTVQQPRDTRVYYQTQQQFQVPASTQVQLHPIREYNKQDNQYLNSPQRRPSQGSIAYQQQQQSIVDKNPVPINSNKYSNVQTTSKYPIYALNGGYQQETYTNKPVAYNNGNSEQTYEPSVDQTSYIKGSSSQQQQGNSERPATYNTYSNQYETTSTPGSSFSSDPINAENYSNSNGNGNKVILSQFNVPDENKIFPPNAPVKYEIILPPTIGLQEDIISTTRASLINSIKRPKTTTERTEAYH